MGPHPSPQDASLHPKETDNLLILPGLKYLVNTLGPKILFMENGDADSELLLMELPLRFQEQKFGIRNSMALFDFFGQIRQKGLWNSEF